MAGPVIGVVGDLLVSRAINGNTVEKAFEGCDVLIGNLEAVAHDYQWAPSGESGGTWTRCPPEEIPTLARLGFRLMARANNHALDWGQDAMQRTSELLDAAGIAHAGVGENLEDAARATIYTVAGTRIALVSATLSSPSHATASPLAEGIQSRAGVMYIPVEEYLTAPAEDMSALLAVARRLGLPRRADNVTFGNTMVRLGTEHDHRSHCDSVALRMLNRSVREARNSAEIVVVSLHSHQFRRLHNLPAEALVEAARSAADAGAHVVACHGPHVLRGIDRSADTIILYGLGSAIYQPSGTTRIPPEALRQGEDTDRWRSRRIAHDRNRDVWRSVVATVQQTDTGIRVGLRPLVLESDFDSPLYGLPRPAQEAEARAILGLMRHASRQFDVTIDECGILR